MEIYDRQSKSIISIVACDYSEVVMVPPILDFISDFQYSI